MLHTSENWHCLDALALSRPKRMVQHVDNARKTKMRLRVMIGMIVSVGTASWKYYTTDEGKRGRQKAHSMLLDRILSWHGGRNRFMLWRVEVAPVGNGMCSHHGDQEDWCQRNARAAWRNGIGAKMLLSSSSSSAKTGAASSSAALSPDDETRHIIFIMQPATHGRAMRSNSHRR